MTGQRQRMRERREQLEAMLATGQARLERARSRSMVVDTAVGVIQRERPVAVGILAGSLAFRLFALMIPFTYVLVAGLGFAAAVLEVLRWVHLLAWRLPPARARTNPWLVLGLVGGFAVVFAGSAIAEEARADAKGLASELTVILTSAGVELVVLAVLWLALTWAMPRPPCVPWTALVPGACLFAVGFIAFNLAVSLYFAPRAARASTVYGSLGLALILLVSLFLFARLAVAAAELNATLWERRRPAGTVGDASA